MTNGEKITKFYPKNAALIRERIGTRWDEVSEMSAPNIIASLFDWYASPEGWEFWNELYESGHG